MDEREIERYRIHNLLPQNKYEAEVINPGKLRYKDYLREAYGEYKSKRMLNPKTQNIIQGIRDAELKREKKAQRNDYLFEEKGPPNDSPNESLPLEE